MSNFSSVTINWGDGSQSQGQLISKGNGLFLVEGNHGYPNLYPNVDMQVYAVSVSVQDSAGNTASTSDSVVVGQIS